MLSRRASIFTAKAILHIVRTQCFFSTRGGGAVNVLIVGGGPVGSSTAYHLAQNQRGGDGTGILILEQDPTYKSASAMASVGGVRQQFSLKENVEMSLYGQRFIEEASDRLATRTTTASKPDLQFVPGGYLFLAQTALGVARLKENNATQIAAGCEPQDMQLHQPSQLESLFPWLNVEDILLGSHGSRKEGWFDPWAYLWALREKNKSLGVQYLKAKPVKAKRNASGVIESVQLFNFDTNETESLTVDMVVNAAGAYSGVLVDLLAGTTGPGVQALPVKPRKRSVFFFQCDMKQEIPVPSLAPLTVDPTGVYFRSEGKPGSGTFVCGVSPLPDQDPDCWNPLTDLQVDHHLWDEIIWPSLFHRVPAFGAVKVISGWAGLYDYNTLDQNAIIDFHSDIPNLLLVTGFSGHGLQHSPAAGRGAAELLECGLFKSIDLSIFSFRRCIDQQPVFEQGIV
jgi:FAD-dependent oxidoreductase domain-containing protein 1